jgi:DNA polymerase-3 subunit delta'
MEPFASVPEQAEAKRLLGAALAEGPAHAYLFHGPRGVGKRTAALAFAAALLGDERRVLGRRPVHPDLRVVEPLGDMIRIDEVRALHHDLHMRPFEGSRRVYLLLGADLLNEDAADALLKDLEEPPGYATIVLVADELGPLPPTILSRCQLVPFRRLSERAVRAWIAERAADLADAETLALARVAGGRLDRAGALLDPQARARRAALLEVARAAYRDPAFETSDAAQAVLADGAARGAEAKAAEEEAIADLELTVREAEQRVRRAQRGAERESLLTSLEELAAWYRDLVVVAAGAERAAVHADRLDDLREDVALGVARGAEDAAALCREVWRAAEEFNVNTSLTLEALFTRIRRAFAASAPLPVG